ncbi:hypothetical protein JW979_11055 [bacterium]|nr:hypothetical protein [candidate division CSSED10-310 bacterium]
MKDCRLRIEKQDREDEKYLFQQRILPISIGLIMMMIVFLVKMIHEPLILLGCLAVLTGLVAALISYLIDYHRISREQFDQSRLEFLDLKEKRLKSWKSTSLKYLAFYMVFATGVILIIAGNKSLIRGIETSQNRLYFTGSILGFLVLSWIAGEHLYRKRHMQKHIPLLRMISKLKNTCNHSSD